MKYFLIALLVVFFGAAAYYFFVLREPPAPVSVIEPVVTVQPESPPQAEPEVEGVEAPAALDGGGEPFAAEPLPSLEDSDPVVLESMAGVIGEDLVARYFVTENLIPRLVATLSMLSGKQVAAAMMPVHSMDSAFEANLDFDPPDLITNAQGDPLSQYLVDPVNYQRYAPYVELLESIDMTRLAAIYQRQQALFQQAYEELGYPDGNFNSVLLETVDMLLAAPSPAEPVRLVKPEAYYLFADPALEALPAGQKLMIRMGNANAQRVKTLLREFRAALTAAGIGQG